MKNLNLRIPNDLHKKIKESARRNLRSLNSEILQAIKYYLKRLPKEFVMSHTVNNKNGKEIDFEAAVELMDDEIRESLNDELAPCSEQEFFSAYEKAHEEKFGEEWELSKSNPIW